MKKGDRSFNLLLGGIIFTLLVGSGLYLQHKENLKMQKSFSLLMQERKSLENHLHHLKNREQALLKRVKKAEEILHSFQLSE